MSELWNIAEMGVGLWSGLQAGSIALIAFGLDSVIEVIAGGVAIWRIRKEWSQDKEKEAAEKKALRLLGLAFFLLSAYIAIQASANLLKLAEEPRPSLVGAVLVIATTISMAIIYRAKTSLAKKIGSRALRAEAVGNFVTDLQDLAVLGGVGLNFLFGWWWADPIAALLLIPFLLKEGLESFRDDEED
ncbi:MAG: cation transporter [Thaumarchaeota archaeon]|nr:cation transporter [Nitrososphaerota archaeon]MCL5316987.1 cation transporter [Nitrososphaerota archaeon]